MVKKKDQPFVGQLLLQTLRHTQIYLGRTRSCSGFAPGAVTASTGLGPQGRTNGFSAKKNIFLPLDSRHADDSSHFNCCGTICNHWSFFPLDFLRCHWLLGILARGSDEEWACRRQDKLQGGSSSVWNDGSSAPSPHWSLVDSYIYGSFMGFYGLWVIFPFLWANWSHLWESNQQFLEVQQHSMAGWNWRNPFGQQHKWYAVASRMDFRWKPPVISREWAAIELDDSPRFSHEKLGIPDKSCSITIKLP